MFRRIVPAIALVALFASCGSSDSDSSGPAVTAAPDAAPATDATSAPGDSAATADTTAPLDTAPTPTAAPGPNLDEACLIGTWAMPGDRYEEWMLAAVPNAPMTLLEGNGPVLALADGRATSTLRATIRFGTDAGSFDIVIDSMASGPYSVDGGDVLAITYDTESGGVVRATTNVGGVETEIPGFAPPDIPNLGGGPASCTDTQLTIEAVVPGGTVLTVFDRVA
jgi:hypothetical protein